MVIVARRVVDDRSECDDCDETETETRQQLWALLSLLDSQGSFRRAIAGS